MKKLFLSAFTSLCFVGASFGAFAQEEPAKTPVMPTLPAMGSAATPAKDSAETKASNTAEQLLGSAGEAKVETTTTTTSTTEANGVKTEAKTEVPKTETTAPAIAPAASTANTGGEGTVSLPTMSAAAPAAPTTAPSASASAGNGDVARPAISANAPAEANKAVEVKTVGGKAAEAVKPTEAKTVETKAAAKAEISVKDSGVNPDNIAIGAKTTETQTKTTSLKVSDVEGKAGDAVSQAAESKKKTKKADAKKKAVKKNTVATETASIPATSPKSFLKQGASNPVTGSVETGAASLGGGKMQEFVAPNLLLNGDDDNFLSNLKIPDPKAKPAQAVSLAKNGTSEGKTITIERNSFKSLFEGAANNAPAVVPVHADASAKTADKKVEVENAAGQILGSEPAALNANNGGKFNALDGMETVDASEVKEIEVDSLNYNESSAAKADAAKGFFMGDNNLKVEVKKQASADIKTMKDAYDALQMGQIETAIEFYKKIVAQNPRDYKAQFGLATAYQMGGQRAEAKSVYKKIIAENPNYLQAVNNYIVLVGDEGGAKSIDELKSLMIKNPNYALIPAQIGSIYYKQKDFKSAAEYYSIAVTLDGDSNDYKYNLALTYDKLGAYERARSLYGSLIDSAFKGEKIPVDVNELRDRYAEISNS